MNFGVFTSQAADNITTTFMTQILTMPSWAVGPAEVMTLSPPRVSTPAPATTTSPTTTTTAIARAMMTQGDEDSIGDLAVSKSAFSCWLRWF